MQLIMKVLSYISLFFYIYFIDNIKIKENKKLFIGPLKSVTFIYCSPHKFFFYQCFLTNCQINLIIFFLGAHLLYYLFLWHISSFILCLRFVSSVFQCFISVLTSRFAPQTVSNFVRKSHENRNKSSSLALARISVTILLWSETTTKIFEPFATHIVIWMFAR